MAMTPRMCVLAFVPVAAVSVAWHSFAADMPDGVAAEAAGAGGCTECPKMMVLPAGVVSMGSPENERERYANEAPLRTVSIDRFAISETEITRGQFEQFVAATGHRIQAGCHVHGDGSVLVGQVDPRASWTEPGFPQTDRHPVVCVSWHDAKAYAAWLAATTGLAYRLPSESEWEYAARAGTSTPYYWGQEADDICTRTNGGDRRLAAALPNWLPAIEASARSGEVGARLIDCDDGSAFTSEVGRYPPNPFGLRDMSGNVWEWVEDCFQSSLDLIPLNGSAYRDQECTHRRTRGGSWDDYPIDLRSAVRKKLAPDAPRDNVGFRIALTLSQ